MANVFSSWTVAAACHVQRAHCEASSEASHTPSNASGRTSYTYRQCVFSVCQSRGIWVYIYFLEVTTAVQINERRHKTMKRIETTDPIKRSIYQTKSQIGFFPLPSWRRPNLKLKGEEIMDLDSSGGQMCFSGECKCCFFVCWMWKW